MTREEMNMEWNDSRPLRTGPGRALAMAAVDSPALAHEIVTGALEGLLYIDCTAADLTDDGAPVLLDLYLRGLAAAAIAVDAAGGERDFTSAADFALHGREVTFLETGATLGMLTQASSALAQGPWVVQELGRYCKAPVGHGEVLAELREKAALAARTKVRGSV